jgi:hypothetical protein
MMGVDKSRRGLFDSISPLCAGTRGYVLFGKF